MPPVVFLALVGAGCYAGLKLIGRLAAQSQPGSVQDANARSRTADGQPKDLGELEWDEKSGVYKPSAGKRG